MTTLKITVNNKRNARALQKILQSMPFVEKIENDLPDEKKTEQYIQLEKILERIEPGSIFPDIENPVSWQKNIRDKWEAY
ncbi:MAG: hypothetical protein ACERKD_23035 [Prolixibacteraceae bacterium]